MFLNLLPLFDKGLFEPLVFATARLLGYSLDLSAVEPL